MLLFAPGDALKVPLLTVNTSNVPTDADANPTFKLYKNGTYDSGVTFTVAKPDTGHYYGTTTIPTTYAEGDIIEIYGTWAISSSNRHASAMVFRVTNRVNAIEGLAENIQTLIAQINQDLIFVKAETNIVKNVLNQGVSLNAAERSATAEAVWDTVDGLDVAAALTGSGSDSAASNGGTNHDYTKNGITLRVNNNAANTTRQCSRV